VDTAAVDTVWVAVAAVLVLLTQAGFATLEAGFSRMKNAGAVMAKVIINASFSIAVFWAIGFGIAFGKGNDIFGSTGWFLEVGGDDAFASLDYSAVPLDLKFFFQATFAAVAVAIVWGTMLDRVKFGAYLPFAASSPGCSTRWRSTGCGAAAGSPAVSASSRTSPAPASCT
jgi:Amt family ammonium transporter